MKAARVILFLFFIFGLQNLRAADVHSVVERANIFQSIFYWLAGQSSGETQLYYIAVGDNLGEARDNMQKGFVIKPQTMNEIAVLADLYIGLFPDNRAAQVYATARRDTYFSVAIWLQE